MDIYMLYSGKETLHSEIEFKISFSVLGVTSYAWSGTLDCGQ